MVKRKVEEHSWTEFFLAMVYLAGMTCFGAFVVAISQELAALATNCSTKATSIETVFIAEAGGAVFGSFLSSVLFKYLNNEVVNGSFLILLGLVSFGLPNVTSIPLLHFLYFVGGIGIGLLDAGENILMEKLFGDVRVEPWLIGLQVGFDVGGFLGVFIELLAGLNVHEMFYLIGSVLSFVGVLCTTLPLIRNCVLASQPVKEEVQKVDTKRRKQVETSNNKEERKDVTTDDQSQERIERGEHVEAKEEKPKNGDETVVECTYITLPDAAYFAFALKTYASDICLGLVIFLLIGSTVIATAFTSSFASTTGIESTALANWQVGVIWLALTGGLVFSLLVRNYLFTADWYIPYLFSVFTVLAAGGCLIMIIPMARHQTINRNLLWTSLIVYGFFTGPGIGLAFQYYPVVTVATEISFAIASLGLNIGAGVIPLINTALWNYVDGPISLFIMLFACLLLSIPLFHAATYFSCKFEAQK